MNFNLETLERRIKVVLVDAHQVLLDGVVLLLKNSNFIEVVATANNWQQLIAVIESNPDDIDVIVTDVNYPAVSIEDSITTISRINPHLQIVILSMINQPRKIRECSKFGILGYVTKFEPFLELQNAILAVSKGERYFSKGTGNIFLKENLPLTHYKDVGLSVREKEILTLIGKAFTSPQISDKLAISVSTVDTHRRNIIAKVGARNSLDLVRYAFLIGLVSVFDD